MNITDFCKKYRITEAQFYGAEKIGGDLDLRGLTSIPDGFNPTVGGSLDLSGLTSIPDGFNPTVGGSLYLSGLTSIPDGFNPTVGGGLDLSGLTSIPDGFNPTVGGSLYLSGRYSCEKTAPNNSQNKLAMHTFKIILTNGMYIIHESKSISYADIRTYSGSLNEGIAKRYVHGKLFYKDGNGPLNDGYIDLYDHSILVIFKIN